MKHVVSYVMSKISKINVKLLKFKENKDFCFIIIDLFSPLFYF